MATLTFNFSACKEPALAVRIANLVTVDIERLERNVFNRTPTNWKNLDKPFKAHYALKLVDDIATDDQRQHMLQALPSYEANAKNYTKDAKRRGRPLTQYIHDATHVNTGPENKRMPRIEMTHIAQDEPPVQSQPEAEMQDDIDAILAAVEAAKTAPLPLPPKVPAQSEPDPVQDALKALQDALQNQPKASSMDEDRVRAIAREEDVPVVAAVAAAMDNLDKRVKACENAAAPNVIVVERKTDGERVDLGVQHKTFATLLRLCQIRNSDGYQWPVWLPGPAGSGKTTAARNVATALGIPFQFTGAVGNPYQLTGFRDAGGHYQRTSFREAFEHGGVFLWDEVDASDPNALTVFNAALENGVCAFPDGVVQRHKDCIIIAAANTYGHGATHEYVGRNKLDAATVDRFIMLDWTYDEALETALAGNNEWTKYVQKARRACAAAGIKHVISPRASIRGNALLADGIDRDQVIAMCVRKGLADDSWRTITGRM